MLEDLPPEVGSLSKLEILNASSNKLQKLPHQFYKLTELRELCLKNNGLKEVDPAIGDLIMLSCLVNYNTTFTFAQRFSRTNIYEILYTLRTCRATIYLNCHQKWDI